jgi:hypothetical protein
MLHRACAATLGTTLLLGACAFILPTDATICHTGIFPAINVEVRDALTGEPAASGAVGTLRDGTFSETLREMGWTAEGQVLSLGGAEERPGRYTVRIEKEGYEAWERTNVHARGNTCGVVTVRLQAELVRADP